MYRYIIRRDILFHTDIGFYLCYGLDMFDEASERVYSVKDVSADRDDVIRLIRYCEALQPSPASMDDIVMDFVEYGAIF